LKVKKNIQGIRERGERRNRIHVGGAELAKASKVRGGGKTRIFIGPQRFKP